MKRELGIARCGLACCLCSENVTCNGCYSDNCPDYSRCENRKCSIEKGFLGDAVKKERLRRDLSQNALAEQAHLSLRTVSDIENYHGNPRFESLCLLASFLNLSVDAVIFNKTEPMDSTMKQIIAELEQCSDETKRLALGTLRGLLSAVSEKQ